MSYDPFESEIGADADTETQDNSAVPAVPPDARRLTFDDIIKADDLGAEVVFLPKWKGTVAVQGLTRNQFHKIRKRCIIPHSKNQAIDLERMEYELIAAAMIDPKVEPTQFRQLAEKNMGEIQLIINAVNRLSGMTREERAEAANAFQ